MLEKPMAQCSLGPFKSQFTKPVKAAAANPFLLARECESEWTAHNSREIEFLQWMRLLLFWDDKCRLPHKRFVAHTFERNLCEFVMQFISRNVAECNVYRVAIYCGAELSMLANILCPPPPIPGHLNAAFWLLKTILYVNQQPFRSIEINWNKYSRCQL